ncbi:MAG: hypothetical protein WC680_03025 [Sulfuricurvum sp.]|jgi:hypothetical protein
MDSDILKRVDVLVKKAYYTSERFRLSVTFALLYHEESLNIVELSKYIRITDQAISLDDNHYFIIFAYTSHENSYKASQNTVHSLDKYFNNFTTCIALDTFDTSKSSQIVLSRLHQILAETKKSSYIRTETEDILDDKRKL